MFLSLAVMLQKYDHWGNVVCHGSVSDIREGHKSFPSGHSSCKILSLFINNIVYTLKVYWKYK